MTTVRGRSQTTHNVLFPVDVIVTLEFASTQFNVFKYFLARTVAKAPFTRNRINKYPGNSRFGFERLHESG